MLVLVTWWCWLTVWCGVINHVLVGVSGVVYLPSDKLLMRPGLIALGTHFCRVVFFFFFYVLVHVSLLSSLLFCLHVFCAASLSDPFVHICRSLCCLRGTCFRYWKDQILYRTLCVDSELFNWFWWLSVAGYA